MKASPSWLGSSLSQPTRRYRKSHRAQVPYSYQGQPRPKGDTSLPGSISSCSAANQLESKRSEACPYFKRKQKHHLCSKTWKFGAMKSTQVGLSRPDSRRGWGREGRGSIVAMLWTNLLDQAIHGKMGLSQERPSRAGMPVKWRFASSAPGTICKSSPKCPSNIFLGKAAVTCPYKSGAEIFNKNIMPTRPCYEELQS